MKPFLSYYSALLWATCHAAGDCGVTFLDGDTETTRTYDFRLQILWPDQKR